MTITYGIVVFVFIHFYPAPCAVLLIRELSPWGCNSKIVEKKGCHYVDKVIKIVGTSVPYHLENTYNRKTIQCFYPPNFLFVISDKCHIRLLPETSQLARLCCNKNVFVFSCFLSNRLWSLSDRTLLARVDLEQKIRSLAFHSDGSQLAAGLSDGSFMVLKAR